MLGFMGAALLLLDLVGKYAAGALNADGLVAQINSVKSSVAQLEGVTDPADLANLTGSSDTEDYVIEKVRLTEETLVKVSLLANLTLTQQALGLLPYLHTLSYLLTLHLRPNEQKSLTVGTINIQMYKIDKENSNVYTAVSPDGLGSLSLSTPSGSNMDAFVAYTLDDAADLLPIDRINDSLASERLVSGSAFDETGSKTEVDGHVDVTLAITRPRPKTTTPICSYISYNNSNFESWLGESCSVTSVSGTHAVCRCSQLGEFTLFWRDTESYRELGYLSWLGCAVTASTCTFTALVITGLRLMKSARSYMRLSFLVALALAEVIFLAGSRYTDSPGICWMVAGMLHYCILATFSWLLVYVIFLGSELRERDADSALSVAHYSVLGWLMPLVITLVALIANYKRYIDDRYCFISNTGYFDWVLLAPAVGTMLLTLVILIHVLNLYHNMDAKTKLRHNVNWSGIRSCMALLPLLGGTWLVGSYTVHSATLLLELFFSVLNIALGIVVITFMFYLNEEIKAARQKKQGRIKRENLCSDSSERAPGKQRVTLNYDPEQEMRIWSVYWAFGDKTPRSDSGDCSTAASKAGNTVSANPKRRSRLNKFKATKKVGVADLEMDTIDPSYELNLISSKHDGAIAEVATH